jgi:hypothetical protein
MPEPTPLDPIVTAAADGDPHDPALVISRCVVCGGTSEQPDGCCSLACAQQAEQELRSNTARIRRVNGDPAATQLRRTIAERNGRLTSALLRWRPRPADGEPTGPPPGPCPGEAPTAPLPVTPAPH